MIEVKGFGSALPERVVTAREVAEWTGGDEAFIADKVGIKSRHFLSPEDSALELAASAVHDLFERTDLKPDAVDLLVYVTQNPDFGLPQNSSLLAHALQLDMSVASFDVGLGCSGWVYGLSVVKGFMMAEGRRNAVLVTCDPYSRIMDRHDRSTVTVFGDAAAATWIHQDRRDNVTSIDAIGLGDFGTDGGRGHQLGLPAGRAHSPFISIDNNGDDATRQPAPKDRALYMSGRKILEFMVKRVPVTVDRCLEANRMTRDDIDLFVFHQASAYMLTRLIGVMDLDPAKVPIMLEDTGNTVSSTIPLVLKTLHDQESLAGKRVLVSGFGVGLSWASNILRFT